MEMQGYFTAKGMALSAKMLSGAALEITRVVAGSGNTANPSAAEALPLIRQTLAVNTPTHNGNTAVIPATLVAANADKDYTLTELGVYAKDTDKTEILYKVYKLSAPVAVAAGSRMVLRFYLEETVSQDMDITVICSPTGLITEEDFLPVRDKVLAGAAKSESVHLTAEELVSYIKGLPRMLNSLLRIYVAGGTVTQTLELSGFYGPGRIWISPESSSDAVTLTGGASVNWCKTQIILDRLTFNGSVSQDFFVDVYATTILTLQNCTIDGTGTSGKIGVHSNTGSNVVMNACTLSNLYNAVQLTASSKASLIDVTGSGNSVGVRVYWGGVALLCGSTPDLVGGASNTKSGGIIAKASGALL